MAATIKDFLNDSTPYCEDVDLDGFKDENNSLIEGSGQTLNISDNQQTHKAVAIYAGRGDFYTAGGTANAIALSTAGSQVAPPSYEDGMRVRFVVATTNTGAVTIDADGIGVVNLYLNGVALTQGDLILGARCESIYGSSRFNITNLDNNEYKTSGTTSSLPQAAEETVSVTHGLGTDDVIVNVTAKGNNVANAFIFVTQDPGDYRSIDDNLVVTMPAAPPSGDVNVVIHQINFTEQTISYRIKVTKR